MLLTQLTFQQEVAPVVGMEGHLDIIELWRQGPEHQRDRPPRVTIARPCAVWWSTAPRSNGCHGE